MDKIDNACERMGGTTRSTVIRWAITEWIRRHPDLVAPLRRGDRAGRRREQTPAASHDVTRRPRTVGAVTIGGPWVELGKCLGCVHLGADRHNYH